MEISQVGARPGDSDERSGRGRRTPRRGRGAGETACGQADSDVRTGRENNMGAGAQCGLHAAQEALTRVGPQWGARRTKEPRCRVDCAAQVARTGVGPPGEPRGRGAGKSVRGPGDSDAGSGREEIQARRLGREVG